MKGLKDKKLMNRSINLLSFYAKNRLCNCSKHAVFHNSGMNTIRHKSHLPLRPLQRLAYAHILFEANLFSLYQQILGLSTCLNPFRPRNGETRAENHRHEISVETVLRHYCISKSWNVSMYFALVSPFRGRKGLSILQNTRCYWMHICFQKMCA